MDRIEFHQFSRSGRIPDNDSNLQFAIDDPRSPYFLHQFDSPGLILVSLLLTGENYASWSRSMVIALTVKNKLIFVDGSIVELSSTDTDLFNSWMRNNSIVLPWILNSISKEISASILYYQYASEIGFDFQERFQQRNGPHIFQLRQELISLKQNQEYVSTYFTKLKSIWEEINNFRPRCTCGKCTCGGMKELDSYHQNEYVMTFLMGLSESFSHTRSQVLLMDPMPAINRVFALVAQEEKQQAVGSQKSVNLNSTNILAMAAKTESHVKPSFKHH